MNTKGFWNRPRPIQLAKLLNIKLDAIITDTVHSASYPSGHTVYSSLVANIIRDLYPQVNTSQLDKVVTDTAKARMMQGVHYPSDNQASIIFSKFVFNKLNAILKKDYYNE
jgi:membrane-associated phospholipid phosphatase